MVERDRREGAWRFGALSRTFCFFFCLFFLHFRDDLFSFSFAFYAGRLGVGRGGD